tara:strand:+ start:841 stop:1017 length:177 start_codon:yes stop_codon:yes gene_type:complete
MISKLITIQSKAVELRQELYDSCDKISELLEVVQQLKKQIRKLTKDNPPSPFKTSRTD